MTTATDGVLTSIGQILVPATDVERATAFYRDTLGMRFLFAFPGVAFFDCGGVRIYIAVPENETVAGHPLIYYRVPDVHTTRRALEARGATFLDQPHVVHRDPSYELWMSFFHDSEENTLALMAEVPLAPTEPVVEG
jgi:methylmalonyl-CoA/ethylmalonyl-CoA epimerase